MDGADGADVRIAMTVGSAGEVPGRLLHSIEEKSGESEREVTFRERSGKLFADLTVGANVAGVGALDANVGLSCPGVKLHGAGYIITPDEAATLGLGAVEGLESHIRQYRNGRDLTQSPRGVMVIDLFGLDSEQVRREYSAVYQWLTERVKPERDQNNCATYRDNWWLFGESRKDWRKMVAGLPRYIATVETTKHRVFQFLDQSILPDNMLVNIATDDAFSHGVLSSRVHAAWALAAGGRLGIGNDPRYNKTRCFETFPFPEASDEQQARIGAPAAQRRDLGAAVQTQPHGEGRRRARCAGIAGAGGAK